MDHLKDTVEMRYTVEPVKKRYLCGEKLKYVFFWGYTPPRDGTINQTCLSQWWQSDFEVDSIKYCCMEQFMMASKARLFGDTNILPQIMSARDQAKIKALGRKVKGFDEKLWNEHKFTIVYYGNMQKFSQNDELKSYLLSTKDKILVEASPYDGIWGIKLSADDERAKNPVMWQGQNLLGFALMQVRDELG